jgi:hypothetical protein
MSQICRHFHGLATWMSKITAIFRHLNSVRPTTKFTMEVEANDTLPFFDALVMKRSPKLATKVYQKPTHTGHYLHFQVQPPTSRKKESCSGFVSWVNVIWQDQKDFDNKIKNIRHDLMFNGYLKEFVDSIMKPFEKQSSFFRYSIWGQSSHMLRVFPRNSDKFNVRTIFRAKHTLHGTLMRTGLVRDAQQMKHCMYNIPCDCGRCYIGETSRPLEVHIKEHKK